MLVPELLPPNDGGISYGQLAVASARLEAEEGSRCSGLTTGSPRLAQGGGLLVVLFVALLLGLRHASDPDHLAAVSTLIASDPEDGTRRAGRLGLAWGAGHALTLALFGLPIVLLHAYLPDRSSAPPRPPWAS